jgi:hypothetical protein
MTMEKRSLLQAVSDALQNGTIQKSDLEYLLQWGQTPDQARSSLVTKILYYVGGLIIFLGLCYYVTQEWSTMDSVIRIITTLGFGLGFSAAGTALYSRHSYRAIGDAFHLISGLLIPTGVFVTLWEMGYREGRYGSAIVFAMLTALAYIEYVAMRRRTISLVFTFVYGSLAYLLLGTAILSDSPLSFDWNIPAYQFLTLGLAYILVGYAFTNRKESTMTPALYFFGVPAVLGSTLALQGFFPSAHLFWEIVYPGILFGSLVLAVYLKSRSFLIYGALFIVGYIFKIMDEYFSDSVSGAFLLIVSGIIIMGVGYLTVWLNKRYFKAGDRAVTGAL